MNLSLEVEAYLAKARHASEVATKLHAGGDYPDAVGKAYYAMFYVAQALLKAHDINVTKHSAVVSKLGQHFAKAGRLDPKFHRMFVNARKYREKADYGLFEEISQSTAQSILEDSVAFVKEVEYLLRKK